MNQTAGLLHMAVFSSIPKR